MVEAVVTDVDGVMVGNRKGVNFPLPDKKIIDALKTVRSRGIPIVLCTAKFGYAIQKIIIAAHLNNPHISDGGALIFDPINNIIVQKYTLEREIAESIIKSGIKNTFYLECYTADNYFILRDQVSGFTKKRTEILQKPPTIVESFRDISHEEEIIKINVYLDTKENIPACEAMLKQFEKEIHYIWTQHPAISSYHAAAITTAGVSKASAAKVVSKYLHVSFENILGIGDMLSDWNFMKLCKFNATVGTESAELQKLIRSKGEGNYFSGPSIQTDGLLEVFKYFI